MKKNNEILTAKKSFITCNYALGFEIKYNYSYK